MTEHAAMIISEEYAHGDFSLQDDLEAYARSDRRERIRSAASSLYEWAYEYLSGDTWPKLDHGFTQEQLPVICKLAAIAMLRQYEHDSEQINYFAEEAAKARATA